MSTALRVANELNEYTKNLTVGLVQEGIATGVVPQHLSNTLELNPSQREIS